MLMLRSRHLAAATAALLLVGACTDAVTGPDDAASQVDLVSGDNQSGRIAAALESPVVVRVLSRTGRPVFGATVRFAPDADAGSVAATSVLTDSSGLAQTTWTLSAALGTKTLTAFVAGVDTVRFTATAVPDRLELVSGNNQLTRAGAELTQPVVVRLVDLSGRPAVGVAVTFAPTAGNGSAVPSVVATDASGTARTVWTLSATLGPKTLQVSAASATSTVTVNATATQDQLTLVSGGSQTIVAGGALPAPVVVRVLDQFGTAVPGVAVSFTPGSGSGTVSQTSVFTDNTGTASTSWTLGATPGSKALTVAAGSATPLTVSAIALSTDSIQVVSGSAQAGRAGTALAAPIVVRVRDGAGRAVQGATVTFTPDAGNGSVTAATATTDAQGQAQTTWTLGSALGAMRLVARVGATATVAVNATVTRDRLDVVSGGTQVARPGTTLAAPIIVRLTDLNGALVAGVPVTFAPVAGSVLPATVVTDATGQARTAWTLGATPGLQQMIVRSGTADSITVAATAVRDSLRLLTGGAQTGRIGLPLNDSITVVVVDPTGAGVPNVSVTFATASGSVSPATVTTNAQGRARTAWTLGATPGAVSLTASAANTEPLTIAATATQDGLSVVSGDGQVRAAGAALGAPVVVQLRDQAGAVMPGVTVTFTPGAGSGSVGTASAVTDGQGRAQTAWTLGAIPGAKTLTISGGTAAAITVRAIALGVDSLLVTSGNAQAAQAGQTLAAPITVVVREREEGRVVPGALVTFTPAAGSGSVSASTVVTDAQGQAQTAWTLGGTTGAQTVTVTTGNATARTVTATATADQLTLLSGGGQIAKPSTILAQPIVVRVSGLAGQPLAGIPVTFAPSAGSVLPATVVTDAQGQARTAWTLGASPGAQTLTVSGGTASALAVAATAVRDSLRLIAGGGQSGRIATALTDSVTVRVVDLAGAGVPNVSVAFATTSGSASPATVTTNAQGLAKTRWTLGATPGPVTLTASAAGTEGLSIAAAALRADSVTVIAGGAQTGLVGATLAQAVKIEVRDRTTGAVVRGVPVTFAPGAGSGTVSAGTVTTDAAGLAQTLWTLGTTIGAKTLAITTTETGSTTATATATVDTSRTLVITGGNGQTGTVNTTLPTPLGVSVTDRYGNPVAGATILWNDLLTNGVTVAASQSVTDAAGAASTTARLGVALDSALVRAKLAGRTETVTFLATAQVAMANVAVGNFFSCATAGTGASYCWGTNGNGQLGTGSLTDALDRAATPVTLGDSLAGAFPAFRSMSLGRTTACGVTLAKRLVCWGAGSGTFGSMAPMEITFTPSVTVERVAAGEGHTCFIDIDGLGWCGGENRLGQLGNYSTVETTGNAAVPVLALAGGVPVRPRLATVAAGRSFSCAFRRFDPADATTRRPICWGDNALGQLGRNSTASDSAAATVADPLTIAAFDSTSLVTGLDHACVLSTAGNAYCWGSNGSGQLGNGGAVGSGQRQLQMVAVTMPAGQTFTRLAAGEYHTCGITPAGAAYCWGRNGSGQLGDGTQTDRSAPTAVAMPVGVTFKAISLGELHSCAIAGTPPTAGSGTTASTGRVFCWGDNEYGQLGDGAASGNRSPVLAPKAIVNQP